MASTKYVKVACLVAFTLLFTSWLAYGTLYTVVGTDVTEVAATMNEAAAPANADDYVGSETCKTCHEDQFAEFAGTKHFRLSNAEGWKDKVQGCESCHGPGNKHIENPSPTTIISFKNKNSKQISETCLTCHAGKEAHNNFRRGEHWRNDVGCTDCHTAHGSKFGNIQQGSMTLVAETSKQNPSSASNYMLKASEPQLCMSCHNETKAQFTKPFHHKVLEGTMKCSDCHNAHGGFEQKQTRLAVGADAACIKCHTDKQGPFVFEHAPLKTEGCQACHIPHGSANPKLLKRASVKQLCMECHSTLPAAEGGAPQTPHDLRTSRYNNCTVCHLKIHGSNAHTFFFR